MPYSFIESLGFDYRDSSSLRTLCKVTGLTSEKVRYYQDSHVLPNNTDLSSIEKSLGIDRITLSLKMGLLDDNLRAWLAQNASSIAANYSEKEVKKRVKKLPASDFRTRKGRLYNRDCMEVLPSIKSQSVDLVFADPPFNLNKFYGDGINDSIPYSDYEAWCHSWINECIRILKPGGSFFLWHIPKWSQRLSAYIDQYLEFRHAVAVKMNYGLPISGRLYPSHYSLLYFTNGKKPDVFQPDRVPIDACKNCGVEHRDYGGHKDKLNPRGLNLQDVWLDINPVKHKKKRIANELPLNLLDRIIEMSTKQGALIVDPFAGSGVSCIVAELKGRKWIGCELGDIKPIVDRFDQREVEKAELSDLRADVNKLFSDHVRDIRIENNDWVEPPMRAQS